MNCEEVGYWKKRFQTFGWQAPQFVKKINFGPSKANQIVVMLILHFKKICKIVHCQYNYQYKKKDRKIRTHESSTDRNFCMSLPSHKYILKIWFPAICQLAKFVACVAYFKI